jgi:protein pelota
MRSSFDLKHDTAKITPETMEDLDMLRGIITPGSLVTSKSPRSIKIKREGELVRAKTGRKEVLMKVQVEKVELSDSSLRINGKIVEAPEDVEKGYHTIDIEPDKFLVVEKPWKGWEVDRIRSAEKRAEPVIVCILDENEADVYLLKERYKFLLHIDSESSGKRFDPKKADERQKAYLGKVLEILRSKSDVKKIIVAGPAFAKEDLQKLIKEREKPLLEKIITEATYQTGETGLQELLKKGLLDKLTKMSRVTDETQAVESLLQSMSSNGKAVYGAEKTREAVKARTIRLLLVSDSKISDYEDILDAADEEKLQIMVVSSKHEAGEKLLGLGGIAGLLF